MNKTTSKRGFTIIEVVLVLAIAALIFMMVFLAWPALQRNQRDDSRRRDAGTVASAIGTYKSNNNNRVPTNFADFKTKYLVKELAMYDNASEIVSRTGDPEAAVPPENEMWVFLGESCAGDDNTRIASVVISLENAKDLVCTEA